MHATCPTHLTLLDFTIIIIVGEGASYEATHYAVFASLQLSNPSWVQIFSLAPFSQIPSVYVPL
jgi:hypothetical protein